MSLFFFGQEAVLVIFFKSESHHLHVGSLEIVSKTMEDSLSGAINYRLHS